MDRFSQIAKIGPVLLGLGVLAACSSAPPVNPELESARVEVRKVQSDPLAPAAASAALRDAQDALNAAESAQARRAKPDEVTQAAYLANRHAQIAEAQIEEYQAHKIVESGEAARNRVVLEARERQLAQASADAQRQQSIAQGAQAEADRLRQHIAELQAKKTERGMVLTLGDVLFATGKSTLQRGADATLDRVAQFLQSDSSVKILIEGHTDNVGSDALNSRLSKDRAQAVADALIAKGVSRERIETVGLSSGYPVADNAASGGRQQNRRVEIIFSDDSGSFSPAAHRAPVGG